MNVTLNQGGIVCFVVIVYWVHLVSSCTTINKAGLVNKTHMVSPVGCLLQKFGKLLGNRVLSSAREQIFVFNHSPVISPSMM